MNNNIIIPPKKQTASIQKIQVNGEKIRNLIKDNQYLKYLCQAQDMSIPIYFVYENYSTQDFQSFEESYIFSLQTHNGMKLYVYENSSIFHSTVIFISDEGKSLNAINQIHTFFNSNEINKRKLIQWNKVDFNTPIKTYRRIVHSSFPQWKKDLENYLRIY